MKRLIYLILSLTIVLSVSVIGCSSSPKESEPSNEWVIDLLNKVPNGSSLCRITNISAMRADPDFPITVLKYLYYDSFDELKINCQNSNYSIETGQLTVFFGNCSREDLKDSLNENGTNHRTILGAEAWDFESKKIVKISADNIHTTPFIWTIAIYDDLLLVGASENVIEDWITFTTNYSPSINSNPDFNDLFGRLPQGFVITYRTTPPDGLDSQGFKSLSGVGLKKNHDLLTSVYIYEYQSEDAAKNAYPKIKPYIESDNVSQNIQVTRDGKYITITADCPIAKIDN